jgi:hypothetical protein
MLASGGGGAVAAVARAAVARQPDRRGATEALPVGTQGVALRRAAVWPREIATTARFDPHWGVARMPVTFVTRP